MAFKCQMIQFWNVAFRAYEPCRHGTIAHCAYIVQDQTYIFVAHYGILFWKTHRGWCIPSLFQYFVISIFKLLRGEHPFSRFMNIPAWYYDHTDIVHGNYHSICYITILLVLKWCNKCNECMHVINVVHAIHAMRGQSTLTELCFVMYMPSIQWGMSFQTSTFTGSNLSMYS
jgi:hypothetical protein